MRRLSYVSEGHIHVMPWGLLFHYKFPEQIILDSRCLISGHKFNQVCSFFLYAAGIRGPLHNLQCIQARGFGTDEKPNGKGPVHEGCAIQHGLNKLMKGVSH